jgi:hypothetical protein
VAGARHEPGAPRGRAASTTSLARAPPEDPGQT